MDQSLSRRSVVQGMTVGPVAALAGSRAGAGDTPDPAAEATGRSAMAITTDEVVALMHAFHELVMIAKGTAAAQAAFFLHPTR